MLLNQQLTFVVLGAIFTWLVMVSYFLYKMTAHYRKITSGVGRGNLNTILEKVLKEQEITNKRIDDLGKRSDRIEHEALSHFQNISLVRFNPFAETGGDQSFTMAVLDGQKSGVVLSSLHGRSMTRIYAKPVKSGKVEGYQLSKEEEEALEKASKN